MNESEYIIVTNRVKLSAALHILCDVLPGDDYGITKDELVNITKPLAEAQDRLFKIIETKEHEQRNIFALEQIARTIQSWLDYCEEQYKKEDIEIKSDNRIIPHTWPSRGVLENWIKVFKGEPYNEKT